MSAYVVSRTDLDVLAKTALEGPLGGAGGPWRFMQNVGMNESADRLGQRLLDENVASVRHRYPDCGADDLPGPTDAYYTRPYRYRDPAIHLTIPEALKAVAHYRYQACEHPGWAESWAAKFCVGLERALIAALPGYEDAPWGFEAEDLAARRLRHAGFR